ncbi:MAG: 2-oxo acid dehydrogenase subunit E2 [Anaerovoracaceae bacterium]
MKQISETIKYKGMLKAIGKRMEVSGAYPMSYQGIYVDVTDLLEFRKKINAERNAHLTVNDYIIKAASISLQRVPIMNSAFNEDMTEIQLYKSCNISVMTASEKGLVAPVVKETQDKTIFQISDEMKELISKANAGKLTPDDYADGTFGITNIGKLNSFDSVPLPMPPEPAIMTACTAKKMPVVLDDGNDTIAVRMMMKLVIGGDHRILQGVPLAQFINSMKELLENPASIIE